MARDSMGACLKQKDCLFADSARCHCRVTAHFVPVKGQPKPKTTILMKFDAAVLAREHRLLP